jgi:hypothetical protein
MNEAFSPRDRIELAVLEGTQDVDFAAWVGEISAEVVENCALALEALTGLPAATFAPGAWAELEGSRP